MKAGSFAAIAAVACLTLAGCEINVNQPWTQVELDQNSLTIPPPSGGRVYNVGIRGGSGDYREEISDWTIADVRIERTFGAGTMLCIDPKREGDAIVTVTDRKTGDRARLSLKVARYTSSFKVEGTEMIIDADDPDHIVAAFANDTSIPPNGGHIHMGAFNGNNPEYAEWAFTDAFGEEIAHGTYAIDISGGINPIFRPLMPQTQIVSHMGLVLYDDGGEQREWYKIVSHRPSTRLFMASYQQGFYEDLTEYCQREFPDAGVRSVARVLITYYGVAKNDFYP